MKTWIAVIDVLQLLRPGTERIAVYLVDEKMGASVSEMVVGKVDKAMLSEPKVVEGNIKGLRRAQLMGFHILKHHGCLTHSTCPTYTEHAGIPVDDSVHVAKKAKVDGLY